MKVDREQVLVGYYGSATEYRILDPAIEEVWVRKSGKIIENSFSQKKSTINRRNTNVVKAVHHNERWGTRRLRIKRISVHKTNLQTNSSENIEGQTKSLDEVWEMANLSLSGKTTSFK